MSCYKSEIEENGRKDCEQVVKYCKHNSCIQELCRPEKGQKKPSAHGETNTYFA